MLKKLLLGLAIFMATTGIVHAEVDVNKADQAALDGIKGLGPKTSQAILDERKRGGDFKDWADIEQRVKGIGGKSAIKLSAAGLTVNGQARTMTSVNDAKAGKSTKKPVNENVSGTTAASTPAAEQK